MRLWPQQQHDEGRTPPYRPLSAEALSACVEAGWEIIVVRDAIQGGAFRGVVSTPGE